MNKFVLEKSLGRLNMGKNTPQLSFTESQITTWLFNKIMTINTYLIAELLLFCFEITSLIHK